MYYEFDKDFRLLFNHSLFKFNRTRDFESRPSVSSFPSTVPRHYLKQQSNCRGRNAKVGNVESDTKVFVCFYYVDTSSKLTHTRIKNHT